MFEKLLENEEVRNHPLIKKIESDRKNAFGNLAKHAQELTKADLMDSFSSHVESNTGLKTAEAIKVAMEETRNMLSALNFPIQPKIRYNKLEISKYAGSDSNEILSGTVELNCDTVTQSGGRISFTVSVPIRRGSVIQPSTLTHKGRDYIIAQSTVDEMISRNTTYRLDPIRKMFSPPFTQEERNVAVDNRNSLGWHPNNYSSSVNICKRTYNKQAHALAMESIVADDRTYNTVNKYYRNMNGDAEKFASRIENIPVLARKIEEASKKGSVNIQKLAQDLFDSAKKDDTTKRMKLRGVPDKYKDVVKDLEKAEEKKEDTFPRPYEYILMNYILNHVNVACKDNWITHLINDGWVVDPMPYGKNRGRTRRKGSTEFKLVDGPKYKSNNEEIQQFDSIKFAGRDGDILATIIKVDDSRRCVIARSAGKDFEIDAEDVEPVSDKEVDTEDKGGKDKEYKQALEKAGVDLEEFEEKMKEGGELAIGGLADGKKFTEFPLDQLLKGIKVEKEHTDCPCKALKITMDHLVEDDKYYDKLAKMESGDKETPTKKMKKMDDDDEKEEPDAEKKASISDYQEEKPAAVKITVDQGLVKKVINEYVGHGIEQEDVDDVYEEIVGQSFSSGKLDDEDLEKKIAESLSLSSGSEYEEFFGEKNTDKGGVSVVIGTAGTGIETQIAFWESQEEQQYGSSTQSTPTFKEVMRISKFYPANDRENKICFYLVFNEIDDIVSEKVENRMQLAAEGKTDL